MVSKYKRRTDKAKWTAEDLKAAIQAIVEGRTIRSVCKSSGIPFSTLQERLKKGQCSAPKLGRQSVFTSDQEISIAEHIKTLANMFYGLTPCDLRRAAFEFAEVNNIKHTFCSSTKMAGRYWLEGFLRRNPSLAVRKPEAISISRIKGFNKEEVAQFYTNIENVMIKQSFPPTLIFNVDETGMGTVQEPRNIIAPKGQKRVGSVTSWERGKT